MAPLNYTPKDEKRFWARVDIKTPNECWLWIGSNCRGYGTFSINNISHRANRIAFEFYYKTTPGNLHVLHSCDNPSCCNPRHLFLGTQLDNMRDMDAKGRRVHVHLTGELNPAHKLSHEDAKAIRTIYKAGGIIRWPLS